MGGLPFLASERLSPPVRSPDPVLSFGLVCPPGRLPGPVPAPGPLGVAVLEQATKPSAKTMITAYQKSFNLAIFLPIFLSYSRRGDHDGLVSPPPEAVNLC